MICGLLGAVALHAPMAVAQNACPPGEVFTPDDGVCVTDPTGPVGDDGADPRLLRFLAPDNLTSFATGTEVAPTGRSSLSRVQKLPLDLTIVVDITSSMNRPTTVPNPDELGGPIAADGFYSIIELTRVVLGDLFAVLSDDTLLTGVTFGNGVNIKSEKAVDADFDLVPDNDDATDKAAIQTMLVTTPANGVAEEFDALFRTIGTFYNETVTTAPPDDHDRELLILTDGQNTGAPISVATLFAFGGFADATILSLPGTLPPGVVFQSNLAASIGARYLDYTQDQTGFLDIFKSGSSIFSGVESVRITNPDGNSYFANLDPFGDFTLAPFALAEGENLFTATALFADGASAVDQLILTGTGTAGPPIPPCRCLRQVCCWWRVLGFWGGAGRAGNAHPCARAPLTRWSNRVVSRKSGRGMCVVSD